MSKYLVVLLALKYFHIRVSIVLLNLSTTTAFPSLCVLPVHLNVVLFKIFLERLVVKFRALVDPEPAWLPSATLDVIKRLGDIFPCFGLEWHDPGILAEHVDDVKQVFDSVVVLGESTHVHQVSTPYLVYSFHKHSSPLETNSSWLVQFLS